MLLQKLVNKRFGGDAAGRGALAPPGPVCDEGPQGHGAVARLCARAKCRAPQAPKRKVWCINGKETGCGGFMRRPSLTALAGCGTAQEELQNVTLCEVTHSIFYAPQYVAMELGFFEEEGLSVELSNGGGADKVMSALLSGSVDIGFAGPEASVCVYNEGKEDYTQVFAQVTQRDGSFLVARQPMPDF